MSAPEQLNLFLVNFIAESRERHSSEKEWKYETIEEIVLSSAEISSIMSGRLTSREEIFNKIRKRIPNIPLANDILHEVSINPKGEGVFRYKKLISPPPNMQKKAQAIYILKRCDEEELIKDMLVSKFSISQHTTEKLFSHGKDFFVRTWPKSVTWSQKIDQAQTSQYNFRNFDIKTLDFIYKAAKEKNIKTVRSDTIVSANIQDFSVSDFLNIHHKEESVEVLRRGSSVTIFSVRDLADIYDNYYLATQVLKSIWRNKNDPVKEFIIEGLLREIFSIEEVFA